MAACRLDDLASPLVVVCHDAGAANLIIGWLQRSREFELRPVMSGPAENLWREAFPQAVLSDLDGAFLGASVVLTGTGWASRLEWEARELALKRNIRTIAVVDHWVNYAERFMRDGTTILPNEIWVADEYAVAEARRCFPSTSIHLLPNFYLEDQVQKILEVNPFQPDESEVLYVFEPIRHAWAGSSSLAGEFQAFDYFLQNLSALRINSQTRIRLRPHPSDPSGKYHRLLRSSQETVVSMSADTSLAQAISNAHWVVGCESFALIVALHAGRRVVSTLPPWAPGCRLPHSGIIRLREIVS